MRPQLQELSYFHSSPMNKYAAKAENIFPLGKQTFESIKNDVSQDFSLKKWSCGSIISCTWDSENLDIIHKKLSQEGCSFEIFSPCNIPKKLNEKTLKKFYSTKSFSKIYPDYKNDIQNISMIPNNHYKNVKNMYSLNKDMNKMVNDDFLQIEENLMKFQKLAEEDLTIYGSSQFKVRKSPNYNSKKIGVLAEIKEKKYILSDLISNTDVEKEIICKEKKNSISFKDPIYPGQYFLKKLLTDENKEKHKDLIFKTNKLEDKFEEMAQKSFDSEEEILSQQSGFYPSKYGKDYPDSTRTPHSFNDFLDLNQNFSEFVSFEKRIKYENMDSDNLSMKTLKSFSSNCHSDFFDNVSY